MPIELKVTAEPRHGLYMMEPKALRKLLLAPRREISMPASPIAPANQKPYQISDGTAIIPIIGPVCKYDDIWCFWYGGTAMTQVEQVLDAAVNDDVVTDIVLLIDSPGGTVAGTQELADCVAAANQIKPITAFVSDMCASAAFWIASQCTQIIANQAAFIGSIGVMSVWWDTSKAFETAGISVQVIATGDYKGLGVDGTPIDPKLIEEVQRENFAIHELFVAAVARGRQMPPEEISNLADGRVYIASEALGLGLIDGIGTLESAIALKGQKMPQGNQTSAEQKPAANAGGKSAPKADEGSGDDSMLKKIYDCVTEIKGMLQSDPDDDKKKDDEDDDAEAKAAKAVKTALEADRARLKSIQEACPGRADFAMTQFLAGKSAVEAKAALADELAKENAALKKGQAVAATGTEPQATGGGSPEAEASDDPEKIWEANTGNVQKIHGGNKKEFLARFKHYQAKKERESK